MTQHLASLRYLNTANQRGALCGGCSNCVSLLLRQLLADLLEGLLNYQRFTTPLLPHLHRIPSITSCAVPHLWETHEAQHKLGECNERQMKAVRSHARPNKNVGSCLARVFSFWIFKHKLPLHSSGIKSFGGDSNLRKINVSIDDVYVCMRRVSMIHYWKWYESEEISTGIMESESGIHLATRNAWLERSGDDLWKDNRSFEWNDLGHDSSMAMTPENPFCHILLNHMDL